MPNLTPSPATPPADTPAASPQLPAAAPFPAPDNSVLVCANGVAVGYIEAMELTAIRRAATRDWTLYIAQLAAYVGGVGRCATRVFFLAATLAFWLIAIPLTLAPDVVLEAWRAANGAPEKIVQAASMVSQLAVFVALATVFCQAVLSNGIGVENLFEQRVFLRVRQKLGIAVSGPLDFVQPATTSVVEASSVPMVQSEDLKVATDGSGANEGAAEVQPVVATKPESLAGQ